MQHGVVSTFGAINDELTLCAKPYPAEKVCVTAHIGQQSAVSAELATSSSCSVFTWFLNLQGLPGELCLLSLPNFLQHRSTRA